jgi:hypothetical protein
MKKVFYGNGSLFYMKELEDGTNETDGGQNFHYIMKRDFYRNCIFLVLFSKKYCDHYDHYDRMYRGKSRVRFHYDLSKCVHTETAVRHSTDPWWTSAKGTSEKSSPNLGVNYGDGGMDPIFSCIYPISMLAIFLCKRNSLCGRMLR